MNNDLILNIIGYIGSALVLVSFLMASVLKLRIINLLGSVVSVIYSLCISAYPTFVMNAALIIINLYYIIKMLKHKNIYHVVDTKADDAHLEYFLNYYKDDIAKYFVEFSDKLQAEADIIKFVYCENIPVGVFEAKKISDTSLEIYLDYTTPAYRDCSVGKYIYENLKAQGFKRIVINSKTNNHDEYLAKMGFVNNEKEL